MDLIGAVEKISTPDAPEGASRKIMWANSELSTVYV